jgi:hypothetical protein
MKGVSADSKGGRTTSFTNVIDFFCTQITTRGGGDGIRFEDARGGGIRSTKDGGRIGLGKDVGRGGIGVEDGRGGGIGAKDGGGGGEVRGEDGKGRGHVDWMV